MKTTIPIPFDFVIVEEGWKKETRCLLGDFRGCFKTNAILEPHCPGYFVRGVLGVGVKLVLDEVTSSLLVDVHTALDKDSDSDSVHKLFSIITILNGILTGEQEDLLNSLNRMEGFNWKEDEEEKKKYFCEIVKPIQTDWFGFDV